MPRLMSPLRPRYMRYPSDIPREGLQVHPLPRENDAAHGDTATPQDALKNASGNQAPDTATETLEEPQYPETIRVAEGTFRQIRDDSLVLLSQGIPHRLLRSEDGPFQIFILPESEDRARLQLALYHKENPPREENPPLPLTLSLQPLWVLLVPVVCTLADFGNFIDRLHVLGLSDADKVLHGQWWRTITALTLHADARHIASNLVSGYIVLNLMSYRTPLARMAPFLAIASAVANFFVAFTVQTDYRALGFSTFVFAAIGALAVIEFRLMPKETHGMLRRFAPLCGAASLAVFLGIGENADVLGHAYGFVAGALCGLIPKKKALRWGTPTTIADLFWVAAYFIIFIVGWKFALG